MFSIKVIAFGILFFISSFLLVYGTTKSEVLTSLSFVMIFVALIPATIACKKGRNFFLWWVYGWMLFLVAMIHSIVIKPTEEIQLSTDMKKCPYCAEIIKREANVCRYCGRDL